MPSMARPAGEGVNACGAADLRWAASPAGGPAGGEREIWSRSKPPQAPQASWFPKSKGSHPCLRIRSSSSSWLPRSAFSPPHCTGRTCARAGWASRQRGCLKPCPNVRSVATADSALPALWDCNGEQQIGRTECAVRHVFVSQLQDRH